MFDWNDEELNSIIWGETGEGGDHIVPYPEETEGYCKKKEWSDEGGNVKATEQKQSTAQVNLHGTKPKSSSNFEISEGTSASGSGIDSWINLHISNAAKTDQDSLDASVSVDLIDIVKVDASEEIAELDNVTAIFQNPQDRKEQGDFVDYGLANIGSFDDLDRIFINDDPDGLWSSSKDASNSPVKCFPLSVDSPNSGLGALRNKSEHLGIKTEYLHEGDQLFILGHGELKDPVCHDLQSSQQIPDHVCYTGNQVNKQKKLLRSRKKLEESSTFQDLYGDWISFGASSTQLKNQNAAPVLRFSSSTVPSQQKQLQGVDSLQCHQISNPFFASSPYTAMPLLSGYKASTNNTNPVNMLAESKPQPLLSAYKASSSKTNPVNKLAESTGSQTMTPQEKIEKLRRRQQMQALLAIQNQQLQFVHQVSCSDQSIPQRFSQENEMLNAEGACLANIEFDRSSIEQDESSTISLVDNEFSVEDTVLFQLQEILAKLDVGIRLCIRDSLIRLAQSVLQRQYASDTSSTNGGARDEQGLKKETSGHHRNSKICEMETKTNPIDRTVAHLLFHRPLELLRKHPCTPESPVSTKLSREHRREGVATRLLNTVKHRQNLDEGSKNSCLLSDPQSTIHCTNNPCLDMVEDGWI